MNPIQDDMDTKCVDLYHRKVNMDTDQVYIDHRCVDSTLDWKIWIMDGYIYIWIIDRYILT